MGLNDYINLITILMAIIPLLKDLKNIKGKSVPDFFRSSWPALIVLCLGAASIILLHVDNSNKELEAKIDEKKQENKIISDMGEQFNTSLKNYHLKYDTGAKVIINETPPATEKPILNFYQDPIFQKIYEDSIAMAIYVKNFGNGIAKNIGLTIVDLSDLDKKIKSNRLIKGPPDDITFIPASGIYAYYIWIKHRIYFPIGNTYLIYVKINYTDEDDKKHYSLRGLYVVPPIKPQNFFFQADGDLFNRTKEFLINNKYW